MPCGGYLANDPQFATKAIHAGSEPEQWKSMAVVPPISLATTFKQTAPGEHCGYEYSRSGNPTRDCLEKCFAAIEGGKYGLVFASGLAATTSIIHMLKAGDHVIATDDLYGGTNRYFSKVAKKFGVEVDLIDFTDPATAEATIKPNTRLVWIETPTNPMMNLVDIKAVAEIFKKHDNIFTVVDNTFLSPYFQRPLELGADMVMHSCSKYLNGHSDIIMGMVVTSDDDLHDRLRFLQNSIGTVSSPFDCYMVLRSLKTLDIRMEKHMKSGLACAQFLEQHPCVEKVLHPGLPSHKQHELAKRQCFGHSGMFSFYIKGNSLEASRNFFQHLKVFTLAESLGGYESLCELPSVMTHASVSPEERTKLGITDGLIRVSVGLEGEQDLIQDLDQALRKAVQ